MFQFRAFPSYAYFIQRTIPEYCSGGFPHSEISGSTDICSSPKLIAACHVLLRLLMPRHSPCALYSLTFRRCGLHILRCNASVSAHPFRHISSSRHKRLRWFVTRVRRGTALASFSTSSKRFWFSWIMQAIYRLLRKIVIVTHIFSDVPQLKYHKLLSTFVERPLCCLAFITFFIVQFSRCNFQSRLKPDRNVQPLVRFHPSSIRNWWR